MVLMMMMDVVMLIDMVMNDLISKSNQPNAPTDPAFLPSFFLPTALGTLCSENCRQFAARLLCLGSLSENYLLIVCGFSEFVCQTRLLYLGSLRIICLFVHVALDFSVFWMLPRRLYSWVFFLFQCETVVCRRKLDGAFAICYCLFQDFENQWCENISVQDTKESLCNNRLKSLGSQNADC